MNGHRWTGAASWQLGVLLLLVAALGCRDLASNPVPDAGGDAPSDRAVPADVGPGAADVPTLDTPAADGPAAPDGSAPLCAPGQLACDNRCLDVQGDPLHCGDCTTRCATATKGEGSAACSGGKCSLACKAGLTLCNGSECVDVQNDGLNCGSCGKPCGAGTVCDKGMCATKCADGLTVCGSDCVRLSDNVDHCGSCPRVCPKPAVGSAVCAGGSCSVACPAGAGWKKCPDNTCVQNGCCGDDECGVCQACISGRCQNQALGQDRKNECGGRGCSSARCRECLPSELPTCVGSSLRSCGPDGFRTMTDCEFGCTGNACVTCGSVTTCYRDEDMDGFGDPAVSRRVCGACPAGYVTDKRDCYDQNNKAFPRMPPDDDFADFFDVHRGDGNWDYTCDGKVTTSPPDPDKGVCTGVRPDCNLLRMSFDASKCGTLTAPISCSCNTDCMKSCRPLGGTALQIRCR